LTKLAPIQEDVLTTKDTWEEPKKADIPDRLKARWPSMKGPPNEKLGITCTAEPEYSKTGFLDTHILSMVFNEGDTEEKSKG
jgi:hypothetical protein